MRFRPLRALAGALALTITTGLHAQTFSTGMGTFLLNRSAGLGIGTQVSVADAVRITEFGTWISNALDMNIKFMIWDRTGGAATKVYEATRFTTAFGTSFRSTGPIDVMLEGGRTYTFAVIADQQYQTRAFTPPLVTAANGFATTGLGDFFSGFETPQLVGPSNEFAGSLSLWATPTNVVPEPSTYALLATGLAGVGAVARRRRTRA